MGVILIYAKAMMVTQYNMWLFLSHSLANLVLHDGHFVSVLSFFGFYQLLFQFGKKSDLLKGTISHCSRRDNYQYFR